MSQSMHPTRFHARAELLKSQMARNTTGNPKQQHLCFAPALGFTADRPPLLPRFAPDQFKIHLIFASRGMAYRLCAILNSRTTLSPLVRHSIKNSKSAFCLVRAMVSEVVS